MIGDVLFGNPTCIICTHCSGEHSVYYSLSFEACEEVIRSRAVFGPQLLEEQGVGVQTVIVMTGAVGFHRCFRFDFVLFCNLIIRPIGSIAIHVVEAVHQPVIERGAIDQQQDSAVGEAVEYGEYPEYPCDKIRPVVIRFLCSHGLLMIPHYETVLMPSGNLDQIAYRRRGFVIYDDLVVA